MPAASSVAERMRRAERYLSKMGSAPPGQGDEHAYVACKVGLGFDLSETEFWPLLAAWNASTARPRDERQLAAKLSSVYRKTSKAPGWLLEGDRQRTPQDPTPPRRARAPKYPPAHEVVALWERAGFVPQVDNVRAWVEMRGINYAKLGDYPELAIRGLPKRPVLDPWPAWACCGQRPDGSPGRPWYAADFQALIPLVDARGQLVSFKARWCGREGAPPAAKSLPPYGYDIHHLFMASWPAIQMLVNQRWPSEPPHELRLVEGEPDFLTAIQVIHESARPGRGVLGIFNGSWSVDLFRRIPADTAIVFDGHQDAAGGSYLTKMIALIQSTGLSAVLKSKNITIKRTVRAP